MTSVTVGSKRQCFNLSCSDERRRGGNPTRRSVHLTTGKLADGKGAGKIGVVGVAPAVGNAVFQVTGNTPGAVQFQLRSNSCERDHRRASVPRHR